MTTQAQIEARAKELNITVRIQMDDRRRYVALQPLGFWSSDMVNVSQNAVWESKEFTEEADVSWGSGGSNGELSEVETAKSFAGALMFACEIATAWNGEG